jgi:hypothetical protein
MGRSGHLPVARPSPILAAAQLSPAARPRRITPSRPSILISVTGAVAKMSWRTMTGSRSFESVSSHHLSRSRAFTSSGLVTQLFCGRLPTAPAVAFGVATTCAQGVIVLFMVGPSALLDAAHDVAPAPALGIWRTPDSDRGAKRSHRQVLPRPPPVRYMSVHSRTQWVPAGHGGTWPDHDENGPRAGKSQLTGRLCRWWQVLGSNQRRLSRRFYRPLPLATRATCLAPSRRTGTVKDSGRAPVLQHRLARARHTACGRITSRRPQPAIT